MPGIPGQLLKPCQFQIIFHILYSNLLICQVNFHAFKQIHKLFLKNPESLKTGSLFQPNLMGMWAGLDKTIHRESFLDCRTTELDLASDSKCEMK